MVGCNIPFKGAVWNIFLKLSLLSLLIWGTDIPFKGAVWNISLNYPFYPFLFGAPISSVGGGWVVRWY